MIWPSVVFNLCVGLLFAGYLLRAVRRFERRADAIMAKLDRWHAEEMRKYDTARDEIRESMRAQVDAAIDEMQRATQSAVDQMPAESRNQSENASAELHPLAVHEPDGHLPNSDPDSSDGPIPTKPIEH